MTAQERQEILGRLAASEIASLKGMEIDAQQFQIEIDACLNVISVLNIPAANASGVVGTLIRHLQGSDLTINFRANKFFETMPNGSWRNTFQQGNSGTDYIINRNRIEETLFDYSGTSGRSAPLSVLTRIRLFGGRTNNANAENVFFKAAMRPKYAALNYARYTHGAASVYGPSYVILREHIKHNSTFTDRDSLNYANAPDAANKTANYHNMGRLIANMGSDTLTRLYNAATQSNLPIPPSQGLLRYLEAQVHASIEFNRDVKAICIANGDLTGTDNQKLRETITKFARKNGVVLRFI